MEVKIDVHRKYKLLVLVNANTIFAMDKIAGLKMDSKFGKLKYRLSKNLDLWRRDILIHWTKTQNEVKEEYVKNYPFLKDVFIPSGNIEEDTKQIKERDELLQKMSEEINSMADNEIELPNGMILLTEDDIMNLPDISYLPDPSDQTKYIELPFTINDIQSILWMVEP